MIKHSFILCVFVTVALLMSAAVTLAQQSTPAIEYQSLLNMRYYEADGGFLVDDLQLVFPSEDNQKLSFVITRKTGEELARVPLRTERLRTFDVFRLVRPNGVPGVVRISQSGDFVMTVMAGDQAITRLPFSLKQEKSNDAYNPKTTFVREGPWSDWAYLSSPIEKPDEPMRFNFWISLREMTPGLENPQCTVHVLQGGTEVAATRSHVIPSYVDWQFFKVQLIQSNGPKVQWLTSQSLSKLNGDLTLVVKVNGQVVKSYRLQMKGGQPVRLARNQLEVEPHTNFVPTRLIDLSRDGGCDYCMLDLIWVSKAGR